MRPDRFARNGKTGFTLAEIVASIALIAVVGVLLVQMFATSDTIAAKAHTLDRAVSLCASVADRWKSGTEPEAFDGIPEIAGIVSGGVNWSYLPVDKMMRPCSESAADYIVSLVLSDCGDGLYDLQIRIIEAENGWKTGQPAADRILHELKASNYFGWKVASE